MPAFRALCLPVHEAFIVEGREEVWGKKPMCIWSQKGSACTGSGVRIGNCEVSGPMGSIRTSRSSEATGRRKEEAKTDTVPFA